MFGTITESGTQNLRNILDSNGVHILENTSLHFEKSNFSVRIVGINDGFANVMMFEAFK